MNNTEQTVSQSENENRQSRSGDLKPVYAHSLAGHPPSEWQALEEHSKNVAEMAAEFAKPFGSSETACLLGTLHDIGKSRKTFQAYLLRQNGIDDGESDHGDHAHAGAGACWAVENFKVSGQILAYPIAGHHAGLTDWYSTNVGDAALSARLVNDRAVLNESSVKKWISNNEQMWKSFRFSKPWNNFVSRDSSLWIRMLFSCLVDADFLDTEAFMDHEKSKERGSFESFEILAERFLTKIKEISKAAEDSSVNRIRNRILNECEESSEWSPGLFSLTVPTGGGKTLSSTAWAFRHAVKYKKKRIIYVIPYTSIIEQTSDILRSIIGAENVLEHHCNLDPVHETTKSRLASENWDAPIIVTTAVQFFESLYACKSGRCRKIHNICDSVVIIDEAQLLPPHLLIPVAESIHQLVSHYGCSILLSTATQTSMCELNPLMDDPVREIIPQDWNLYKELKRTEIDLPLSFGDRKTWVEVAEEITQYRQVLCVVNTRKDCRELFDLMPEGTIHLSASMCGEHRSQVIAEIKRKLKAGDLIRVISTQLVEAGVDIDFPVVYRAFTGLPSIVQTAGRCNREGKLAKGKVVVFMPPKPSPCGSLRWYEDAFINQRTANPNLDLDSPDVFPDFYRYFYALQHDMGTVFKTLLEQEAPRGRYAFREAAEKFQLIDSANTQTVIVRFGENDKLIESLRAVGPKRDIMRKLQRFTVSLPKWTFAKMMESGAFEEIGTGSGIFVQTASSVYSEKYGLDLGWQGLTIDETIL